MRTVLTTLGMIIGVAAVITIVALGSGVLGILAGFLMARGLTEWLAWPTAASMPAAWIAFGFAAAVGIFFGWYPARKAAATDRGAPVRTSVIISRMTDGSPALDIPTDEAPSSTGLDRNFAAALAYLAGPFSGITILLAERRNRYVRFHAWQAVLGLGGLGLLAFLFLVGALAGLVFSPAVFTTLYRLAFAALFVWVVLWIVLLVQAFTGRAWRLPLVGDAAARRAERV